MEITKALFSEVSLTKISIAVAGVSALAYAGYSIFFTSEDNTEKLDDTFTDTRTDAVDCQKRAAASFKGLIGVFSYDEVWREEKSHYHLPIGLVNLGNTCYMNSLLQALVGSSIFVEYVEKLMNTLRIQPDHKDSILTFRALEVLLNLSKGSVETSPRELYTLLCDHEFTQHYEQMDSHELLMFLQDNITKVTARHLRESSVDLGLSSEDLLSTESTSNASNDEEDSRIIKGSLILKDLEATKKIGINPLAGVYISTITCIKCGKDEELNRWEVFYGLSLDCKPTLIESLNSYFKGEQIQDFTCIKCSLRSFLKQYPRDLSQIGDPDQRTTIEFLRKLNLQHDLDEELFVREWKKFKSQQKVSCKLSIDKLQTTIVKKFSVSTLPKILSIHFKRIYYNQLGQMCLTRQHIKFPEFLDLKQVDQMKQFNSQVDAQYKLCGVIEHFGGASGGHYVGYRPLFPNSEKWVLCDDSETTIIEKEDVLSRNAYMLFY